MADELIELAVDALDIERALVRSSFLDFVVRFWSTVEFETLVLSPHVVKICGALQKIAENYWAGNPSLDGLVNIPPGMSKSSLCSVFFLAWCWARVPSTRFVCASYTDALAMKLSRKCRDVIGSEKWRELFPEIKLRDDQSALSEWANVLGGVRTSVGIGGSIIGVHGDFAVIDDPIDPNGATSDAELETACTYCTGTIPGRLLHKGRSPTILVMQRLHQRDPAAVMLENAARGAGALLHVNLPAEVFDDLPNPVRPEVWRRFYKDGLLDPVRLSRETLKKFEITMGRYAYSGQMLQNPVPLTGGMFDVSQLVAVEPPPRVAFKVLYRAWDKAGTSAKDAKGRGARTAGVLIGEDERGRFWVLDVVRGQWSATDREAVMKLTAQTDGVGVRIVVEQEPGSGGKESAEATVRNLAGFVVEVDRPVGRKELRADPFSVQVGASNVSLALAPWNKDYVEEMRFFPKSDTKDQIDGSSMAFAALVRARNRVKLTGFGALGLRGPLE